MSAPTVTNDRIFFGSHDGYVYSLDLSGNLIWRYYIGNWVFRSPVIADEMVYVGSAAKFVALDAATGTKQWELDLGTWVEISWSEVVGGMIYLGTANGELIALDATNGEERWRYQVSSITAIGTSTPESAPISAWIHDPPIVVDGVVYIASADHFIYSIDAATGIERWRFETSQAAYPSPVVVDGTVYATSNDGHIYALDSATGTLIWTEDTLGGIMSRVVVTNRVLYVTFDRVQGRLAAFDATTGQELWTYFYEHAVRYEFNDPILHDGLILTGTECQGMFAIDATTGTLAWHVLGS